VWDRICSLLLINITSLMISRENDVVIGLLLDTLDELEFLASDEVFKSVLEKVNSPPSRFDRQSDI
jgi:hypothetical protein